MYVARRTQLPRRSRTASPVEALFLRRTGVLYAAEQSVHFSCALDCLCLFVAGARVEQLLSIERADFLLLSQWTRCSFRRVCSRSGGSGICGAGSTQMDPQMWSPVVSMLWRFSIYQCCARPMEFCSAFASEDGVLGRGPWARVLGPRSFELPHTLQLAAAARRHPAGPVSA